MKITHRIGSAAVVLMAFTLAGLMSDSWSRATVTFQNHPGYTGTQDTSIFGHTGGSADINFGNDATLSVYERETDTVNNFRDLIRFDLTTIAPGAVVNSATLTLTNASGHGTSSGFQERQILNSLYVVDSSNAAWTQTTATWNSRTTSQGWTGGAGLVAGADYNATPIATANTPNGPSDSDNEQMTFTLNAAGITAINLWLQIPATNSGFFMRQADATFSIDSFYSSESATVAFRPLLTVDFVPEPASLGFLSVGGLLLLRRRAHR